MCFERPFLKAEIFNQPFVFGNTESCKPQVSCCRVNRVVSSLMVASLALKKPMVGVFWNLAQKIEIFSAIFLVIWNPTESL